MDKRLSILFNRRSVRRYTDKPLGEGEIKNLMEAAMAAPSANNSQPWHFVVVTERGLLKSLADAHPYGRMMANAACAVAVCCSSRLSEWWVQDG